MIDMGMLYALDERLGGLELGNFVYVLDLWDSKISPYELGRLTASVIIIHHLLELDTQPCCYMDVERGDAGNSRRAA